MCLGYNFLKNGMHQGEIVKIGSVPGSKEQQGIGAFLCDRVEVHEVIIVGQQARGNKPVAYFRMIFIGEFRNILDRLGYCDIKNEKQ